MLVCKGVGAEPLLNMSAKLIDIPLLSCADNGAALTIRNAEGEVFQTIPSVTGNFRSPVTYLIKGWRSGVDMYINARVFESKPPVTSINPCGLYLYNNYHKKAASFVSGSYCKAGRAVGDWYNGPAWFHATSNGDQNGKFNWVFKFTVPVEYE